MTTECHISACIAHTCHVRSEGPFCDLPTCIHIKSPETISRLTALSEKWKSDRNEYVLHIIINNGLGFEAVIADASPQRAIIQAASRLTDLETDNIMIMCSRLTPATLKEVHAVLDEIKDKIEEIT